MAGFRWEGHIYSPLWGAIYLKTQILKHLLNIDDIY